ncbi:unnamed protein product [Caenorhabditis bovis]|uniref:Uncharacterized protein n=1 Tax=Caenorhabditis bovis TaxID=2654633 RepID=A0A8S1ED57_9PELO|nr:unnamed protein product [Caenorhabditis bovis]
MLANVKQETSNDIINQSKLTNRVSKSVDDEEEESSDDEKSVIILESDTEKEGSSGSSDESTEDEEESNEDEESSENESSDDDSDSDESAWSTADEEAGEMLTSEAAEAKIIAKFEKAVILIADKQVDGGIKIMEKLLRNPILSHLHRENINFETLEEPTRLSKVHQVYIGIHKNLARHTEPRKAVEHYLQVLVHQPKNTEIWFNVAMKAVESGNLNYAKYAFEKCENENESMEARATVLYLTHEYHECLSVLKMYQETVDKLNDKMMFLKQKIRSTNHYYQTLCDKIFEEDEVYTDLEKLHPTKFAEFEKRLVELKISIEDKANKMNDELLKDDILEPIEVEISADQDLSTVATIFCDLFDRIQGYSSIFRQTIKFASWEDRQEFLDIKSAVEEIVDVVSCVENITANVFPRKKKKRHEYMQNWKQRLFQEPEEDTEDEEIIDTEDDSSQSTGKNHLPISEIAEMFGLSCSSIQPIRGNMLEKTNNTADDVQKKKESSYFDEEKLLNELRSKLIYTDYYTIIDILEIILVLLSEHCPSSGTCPKNLRVVVIQLYRRLNLITNHAVEKKFWNLHIMMLELGENEAHSYCIKKFLFDSYDKEDIEEEPSNLAEIKARFFWAHVNRINDDDVKLNFLYCLQDMFEEGNDCYSTANGAIESKDVLATIAELEKKRRIESVKRLQLSKNHEDLISIMENDIDFSKIEYEETCELYVPILEYISNLDKNEDPLAMPTLALDLLVKAHEKLGEYRICGQNNYSFIFFIIDELRELIDDIPVLDAIFEKENLWIWANMNQEIAQCLYCLFGKYGKKRKLAEDHESASNCKTDWAIAKKVLPIILVQPLPLHDDKERLGHDVSDLIQSKFEFLLNVCDKKQECVDKFQYILKTSSMLQTEQLNEKLEKIKTRDEDEMQSLVWYAMSLTAYRQGSHDDARKYAELFLTSNEASYDDRLRASAWVILAHEHVHELFQLESFERYEQWRWRIAPFRLALQSQEHEAVIHFEMAATMYQLATALDRFLNNLPSDDLRRKRLVDVEILREEASIHFDRCLALAHPASDGTPPEFQWLCYFFIAKLESKKEDADIVKVVECFYEAACGCELAGFYYPLKVNSKKQTNFEPLEVHYQAHSAVWKYLQEEDNPPLQTLEKIEIYLKTFAEGHRVVKCGNSMFSMPPEVRETVETLISEVTQMSLERDEIDIELAETMEDIKRKLEIMESLKDMCFKAFTLVCERFPHIKSYYRLAQMHLSNRDIQAASDQILKHVFRRKKKDDNLFDNVVEISCSDINRSGSFCYHVERCLRMGIKLTRDLNDLHNLVSILMAMITTIVFDDDQFIEKTSYFTLVRFILLSLDAMIVELPKSARNTPSPLPGGASQLPKKPRSPAPVVVRTELWRLWTYIQRQNKTDRRLLLAIEKRVQNVIEKLFGSVDNLKNRMSLEQAQEAASRRKAIPKKRKIGNCDSLSIVQPFLKKFSTSSKPPTIDITEDDDDDIQCLDGPSASIATAPKTNPIGLNKSMFSQSSTMPVQGTSTPSLNSITERLNQLIQNPQLIGNQQILQLLQLTAYQKHQK